VVVQDDGAGFDSAKDKGMGLIGMEERVRRLKGRFRIDSQPGSGTVLSFLFPNLEPAKDSEQPSGIRGAGCQTGATENGQAEASNIETSKTGTRKPQEVEL
jgi:hypothetical protein